MPNVLIIGPTGFIGSHLCDQLVRSGSHSVFGLTPTECKGFHLALRKIIPVVGTIGDSTSALQLIEKHNIDIVVDTHSFNDEKTKPALFETILAAGKDLLKTTPTDSFKKQQLGFITISQIWSHGSTEDPFGSFEPPSLESLGTTPPPNLPPAKQKYEHSVLAARDSLDIAIIRPQFVFGRGGAA